MAEAERNPSEAVKRETEQREALEAVLKSVRELQNKTMKPMKEKKKKLAAEIEKLRDGSDADRDKARAKEREKRERKDRERAERKPQRSHNEQQGEQGSGNGNGGEIEDEQEAKDRREKLQKELDRLKSEKSLALASLRNHRRTLNDVLLPRAKRKVQKELRSFKEDAKDEIKEFQDR